MKRVVESIYRHILPDTFKSIHMYSHMIYIVAHGRYRLCPVVSIIDL